MILGNRSEFHAAEKLHKIIWIFFNSETPSYCTLSFVRIPVFIYVSSTEWKVWLDCVSFFIGFVWLSEKNSLFAFLRQFFFQEIPNKSSKFCLGRTLERTVSIFRLFPLHLYKKILLFSSVFFFIFIFHLSRTTNWNGTVTEIEITPLTSMHFGETQLAVSTTVCSSLLKIGMKWYWMIAWKYFDKEKRPDISLGLQSYSEISFCLFFNHS